MPLSPSWATSSKGEEVAQLNSSAVSFGALLLQLFRKLAGFAVAAEPQQAGSADFKSVLLPKGGQCILLLLLVMLRTLAIDCVTAALQ